ncbi:MAG: hypothetical protein PVI86_01905 [Phycisphaerae bacterium]|jgi:hypothetical protein
MPVAAIDELTQTIQDLKQASDTALSQENAEAFSDFEKFVNEVEAYVREVQQSMWADQAKRAIKALEKGDALSGEDRDVIRTFLVSDAERYVHHENNYGDWKRELQRLMDDLVSRANVVDRDSIGDMRGVLKDAIRLVPDIRNYLEERQRVDKFQQALNTLDQQSKDMLARLMKEQLKSAKR